MLIWRPTIADCDFKLNFFVFLQQNQHLLDDVDDDDGDVADDVMPV